jgi:hypothetical protein
VAAATTIRPAGFQFDNLFRVMLTGLPSTDWVPPLLRYFDKFSHDQILDFLIKLDNKFSADWIAEYSPTDRIENMNNIIRVVERAGTPDQVLADDCFKIDVDRVLRAITGDVYGRRFARYLLLKLDYLYSDHGHRMFFETLSVEHVLPQNPEDTSDWNKDFTADQAATWTHRLGNLVLITRTKNASQGRLDYSAKKTNYFKKSITTCPNSSRVIQTYDKWTPVELQKNHRIVIMRLRQHYGIAEDKVAAL